MPDLPVYLYDAFSAGPFGGNVAGVVLPPHALPAHTMQRIANELGAPTTGFAVRRREPTLAWDVRYFTPQREIDLCGYVAVAVFTALADAGDIVPRPSGVRASHHTAAGILGIDLFATTGGVEVEMGQRSPVIEQASHLGDVALELLGGTRLTRGFGRSLRAPAYATCWSASIRPTRSRPWHLTFGDSVSLAVRSRWTRLRPSRSSHQARTLTAPLFTFGTFARESAPMRRQPAERRVGHFRHISWRPDSHLRPMAATCTSGSGRESSLDDPV